MYQNVNQILWYFADQWSGQLNFVNRIWLVYQYAVGLGWSTNEPGIF